MKTQGIFRVLHFFKTNTQFPYEPQNSFSPFLHFDSQTHKLQARRRRRRIGVNPLLLLLLLLLLFVVVVVVPSAIVYFFL